MPLTPGTRLGPYEVVARLGAGGMGEVYRATDTRLERTVAIKVLGASATDPHFKERFEREARVVAALNHPHICTLHDVGRQDGVDYLVMEYLEGRTLTQRLQNGPLAVDDWFDVAIQIASALEAAHARHVIHRDIKPANIVVSEAGHVKVLDFGLAKQMFSPSDLSRAVTVADTGFLSGTIDYMSPEQARAREVDARSDIFSLGIVLHEMATGRNPVKGTDIVDTLNRIVDGATDAFGEATSVPPDVQRIVLTCLARDPDQRYPSASALLADLRAAQRAMHSGASVAALGPASPRRPSRRLLTALGAIVLALAALGAWWQLGRGPAEGGPPGTAAAPVRRSVAVLGFQNLSRRPDEAWLSTAISEMLSAELGANEAMRVVAGQNVARAKQELGLDEVTTLDEDTLAKLRSGLGSDLVILGSYLVASGQLRVDVNVQDARAGEAVATVSETGTDAGILQLVSTLGSRLRQTLGVDAGGAAPEVAGGARSPLEALSANPTALRLYAEGIEHLRHQELVQARDALTSAIAADPSSAPIRSAMAEVWSALGYDARAEEEAARAAERAQDLPREDQLLVEARAHEMAKQWDRAIDDYRTLYGFFPDTVDYGLGLIRVLVNAGRAAEALEMVAVLRRLPPPINDDVRIDLAEAGAAHETSDYERELSAGRAAAERGLAQGARLLVAQGRLAEAQAQLRLGHREDASRAVDAARQLFAAAGDTSGEARALNRVANIAYEDGDYARAVTLFREVERAWRSVGNLRDLTTALNNVADTLMIQDRLDAAKPIFEEALANARERRDSQDEGFVLLNLADLAYRQGDLAGAEAHGTQGLELARASNESYAVYVGLLVLGNVALERDDTATAAQLFDEGIQLARRSGDERFTAYLLVAEGDLASAEGRTQTARERYQDALSLRSNLGAETEAAESRLTLARLAAQSGRTDITTPDVQTAVETFQSRDLGSNESYAWAVLATVLASDGRPAEAADAADNAERLLPRVQTVGRRLWIATQIATIRGAQGRRERALTSLRAVVQEAGSRGFARVAREAQRAIADLAARAR